MHGTGEQWYEVYPQKAMRLKLVHCSVFSSRGSTPRWKRRRDYRLRFATRDSSISSMKWNVRCAAAADFATMRPPYSCRANRSTTYAGFRLVELQQQVKSWKLNARDRKIAGELLREIKNRVQFLNDVGLHYLTLARGAATLSNGEAQRIRLASQLGSGLCGVLYVLDEPTIGLHPRDNRRLTDGPAQAARPRQHSDGGRARSRGDRRERLRLRLWPGGG